MKHLYLLVLAGFCLLAHPHARAQEASPAFKTEALTATRQLAAFVSLDDARQLPVRKLTQARLAQEAEVRQQYTNDADMQQKKLAAIGQEYTAQLQQILSPAQYQRYVAAAPGVLPPSVAAVLLPQPAPVAVTHAATVTKPAEAKPKAPVARKPAASPTKAAVRR
ncbi:hypothetical protein [Hymenobacter pini]|uniref:hypothetical protein n=1 Tax=Hymenobacter pini TaxID=2880879 RepID=UPI001CF3E4B2|nr:hypothetical protein [Hymenobacter pini]MCA8831554.1 hypothetical protein [Hymenobacter pini]